MAAHGRQHKLGAIPESVTNRISTAAGLAIEGVALEPHHTLQPLQQRMVEPVLREGFSANENSPRFLYQNAVPPAPQSTVFHSGGVDDMSGCYKYEGFSANENYPRFLCQNAVPPARQHTVFHGGGVDDTSGCYKYEDFMGMLGDRLVSGSLSDVSASASEKIGSGNSSSGEHQGPRVKFMCSSGGRILPRPGDGKLRYVGGDTRIVSIFRHSKYKGLIHKMIRLYGQPVLLKYQLPNEDLDALISISCDEDVDNMMEEYDRLQGIKGSSSKLRFFLFTPTEYESVHVVGTTAIGNMEQLYMEAINGMPEGRQGNKVPINLTGQGLPGPLSSRTTRNSSFVLPIASMPQGMPPLVQHVYAGMIQPGNQAPSRVFWASPSIPLSPKISPHASQIRQPGPEASHGLYNDRLMKAPVCLHDVHCLDAGYMDMECIRSGASSLSPQPGAPYRDLESKRLADSPRKAKHEIGVEQLYYQEQMLMVPPQYDGYGRMSRVSSNRSLMAVQQQQGEILSPTSSSGSHSASLLLPLDTQSPVVMQDQGQLGWQHVVEGRREGAQWPEPLQIPGLENMQNLVASQQGGVAQTFSPVATTGGEGAVHNLLDHSNAGAVSGVLFQEPLTVQSSMQLGSFSIPALYPVSAPSSPHMKFQDVNLLEHYQENQGGISIQQHSAQLQLDNEQAFRGLKPLNTHFNVQGQLLPSDEEQAAMQQLPPPIRLEKHEEIGGSSKQQDADYVQSHYWDGFRQQDAVNAQSHYPDGSACPKTPPYPGGSPYCERLTPFSDQKMKEGVTFGINSNIQEEVCGRMKKPMVENTSIVWTHKANAGEDSSSYFGTRKFAEITPASQILETPSITPLTTLPHLKLNVPLKAPADASSQLTFDGTQSFSPSIYLPTTSDTGMGYSFPVGALPKMENQHKPALVMVGTPVGQLPQTENQQKSALGLASSPVEMVNSKSFLGANTEEGQWNRRVQVDAHTSGEYDIHDGSVLGGRVSRPIGDTEIVPQPLMYSGYGGLTTVKLGEAPYTNMQTTISSGMSHGIGLETSPLSPRISRGVTTVSSPSLSFLTEPSIGPSCLAEAMAGSGCGNLGLRNQREDSELLRPEMLSSCGDRLANTQSVNLVTSLQFSDAVEGKDDVPVFDSVSMEEIEHEETVNCKVSSMADVEPSTLYSAPTLSLQNWEESLATVKLEDVATEESLLDKGMAGISLQAVEREVSVVKAVGENSVDAEWGKLMARAEAEAIARGLQTIRNEDLEELWELGTGTFGTVLHGKWRGTDVAIKRIKASCFTGRPLERDRLIADFWREAYILGQLHHPNVVAFYGVVPDGPGGTLATVTEYMVNGSLKQLLQQKYRTIDRWKRLLIILDAAFGMEYLHGRNIVHFDLKCANLLVNMKDPQRPICKVGDLGLSRVKHQTMVSGGVRGTVPWMAPELLNGGSSLVSEKVDVFSFGIVMWELLTGEEPYENMHYGAIIGGIVSNTLRPPVPSWCEPAWKGLMERCWSADPQARPAFPAIAAELRAIMAANCKSQGQTATAAVVSGEHA